jgi:hypothetical protein
MTLRSGLASQIGYAEESTPGTYVAPTRFLEFNNESIGLQVNPIKSAGLRSANRMLRTDRVVLGSKDVSGQIEHEIHSKGMGLLFKYMHSKAAVITTPMGATNTRDQTFDGLGDPVGLSMTVQKGVPDVGGVVRAFSYVGCKVMSWTLSNSVNGIVLLQLNWDGKDEDTSQALAAASYVANTQVLNYTGGLLNVGGAELDVKDVSITGTVGLASDRHFIRSDRTGKEQITNALYTIEGTLTAEFEDMTAYNRFVNKTLAQLDVTWTAANNIEAGFFPYLKVTLQNVRFTGETPKVSGPEIVPLSLPFEALYDGTNGPITTVYRSSDTAS